jgi:hypothetical protein
MILDDKEVNRTVYPKECMFCRHLSFMDEACKAFPNGIPEDIWEGRVSHKKPYKNDHGIMFESIEVKK